MSKNCRIIKLKNETFHSLIILKHDHNESLKPSLDEMEERLIKNEILNCEIVIDFLLSVRNPDKRFVKLSFENGKFNAKTLRYIKLPADHPIRLHTSKALFRSQKLVQESFLKKSQKRALNKGNVL